MWKRTASMGRFQGRNAPSSGAITQLPVKKPAGLRI